MDAQSPKPATLAIPYALTAEHKRGMDGGFVELTFRLKGEPQIVLNQEQAAALGAFLLHWSRQCSPASEYLCPEDMPAHLAPSPPGSRFATPAGTACRPVSAWIAGRASSSRPLARKEIAACSPTTPAPLAPRTRSSPATASRSLPCACTALLQERGSSGGAGRFVALLEERRPDAQDHRFRTEQVAAGHYLGAALGDAKRVEV